MQDKYNLNPFTLVELGEEIKIISNDFRNKKIKHNEVKEIILHYANTQKNFFDYNGKINKTICKVVGKKRIEFLETLLGGFQSNLFNR